MPLDPTFLQLGKDDHSFACYIDALIMLFSGPHVDAWNVWYALSECILYNVVAH